MELSPYIYKLLPSFADIGSTGMLSGVYELTSFNKGVRAFTLEDGIHYDIALTNTGGAVLFSGTASAVARADCDRCLEDARLELTGEIEGFAVFDHDAIDPEAEADEYILVKDRDGAVDLAPMIFAAIILSLPPVVVCKEDCAGICPACGAHLNTETCSCTFDQTSGGHPFEALEALKEIFKN